MTVLQVYFEAREVGRIHVQPNGAAFSYNPDWITAKDAFPISTRFPLSVPHVEPRDFIPWAANLLPEGSALRTIGQLIQASPQDVVALLSKIGRDTAGALSIGARGSTSVEDYTTVSSKKDLERIITELPRKPFLAGDEGVSMSLAGVQTKMGIAKLESGELAIPLSGSPSTHILKPDAPNLYGSVQNEAFCLVLARLCKLRVPDVITGKAGKRTYLLIARYDRRGRGTSWRRIHQEDFCQALGRPPESKYENNQSGIKGPTITEMLRLTRVKATAPDILRLLDLIIFNVAICNTDAHAKNYSLTIDADGVHVAPGYDLIATQVWGGITPNLAQRIAGKNRGDHLKRRHWMRQAEEAGLNSTRTVSRVRAIVQTIQSNLDAAHAEVAAMAAGDHVILKEVKSLIAARCRKLLKGLDDDTGIDEEPDAV